MDKDLWAALHQEAMRQPDTAAKMMLAVGSYIDGTGDRADEFGYSWNQSKGEWDPDSSVTFVDQLQSAAARQFLRANLKAASEGIKAELETELEQRGKDRELAEGILGSMVGWAMDPASIAGDVTGKLTDFVVKSAVEQALPTEGIHDRYDAKIRSFDAMLDDGVIRDNPWTRVGKAGDELVNDVVGGRVNTEIEAPPQGSVHPTLEAPRVYAGDPRTYVGHLSAGSPGAGIPPQTDNFLIYGTDGKPAGIKAFGEMNPAQREAYTKWLHDPAVQKYLATKLTPKAAAEVLVTP